MTHYGIIDYRNGFWLIKFTLIQSFGPKSGPNIGPKIGLSIELPPSSSTTTTGAPIPGRTGWSEWTRGRTAGTHSQIKGRSCLGCQGPRWPWRCCPSLDNYKIYYNAIQFLLKMDSAWRSRKNFCCTLLLSQNWGWSKSPQNNECRSVMHAWGVRLIKNAYGFMAQE